MDSASSLTHQLRTAAPAPVAALTRLLLGPLAAPHRPGVRHTLLAVCPNSEAVARAALLAAREARAPLLYAATLNQVDRDGGYTGWTPEAFAGFVDDEVDRMDVDVPVFLGLDHGGPWAKDSHAAADLSPSAAMSEAKASIEACVAAGYDLLHLDPAAGPSDAPDTALPIETLVDRSLALLDHAETVRRAGDRGPIAYEVGTDEARGGLSSADRLRAFLDALYAALNGDSRPTPSFVVGDLGTTLDSSHVDADRARRFADTAADFGVLVKGHYTDDVEGPSVYPVSGIGGANVGPGLSAVEADAVRDLAALEAQLGTDSGVADALRTAVVDSGRWKKWLAPNEQGTAFDALPPERQRWLVDTGSRYVWSNPTVRAARGQLYENVAAYRDAEAYVLWRLKTAILRYMHAFNLVGLTEKLADHLSPSS